MSPDGQAVNYAIARFPRVSGDEPGGTSIDQLAGKFSPRERG